MMLERELLERTAIVAGAFRATSRGERGAGHSIYLVVLHDARRVQPWGIYVGQTARDPDVRFDQHKAGYRASGAVRRFGVRLLPNLVSHLNPMRRWEALELEEALAMALRSAEIAWVEGGH